MTTNDMIYKTICTKVAKEPKFKSILEDMGFRVYESSWGACGNWAVSNPETKRMVVFSKGYDNRRRLYDQSSVVSTGNYKKVDYVNYLKTNRHPVATPYSNREYSRYANLRDVIRGAKQDISWYKYQVENSLKRLEDARKHHSFLEKQLKEAEIKLELARCRVDEIKKEKLKEK